ncbi:MULTISPECIES: Acb2/Tad1 domain-containing protein [unclassified Microbacterium]|uniref:Acb2/Tad1 domain-containing protein n=1 Tax=unclassified Microbacterium TaxID=2609290 RepID=UPI003016545E
MALRTTPRDGADATNAIEARFAIAQNGTPTLDQLREQQNLRGAIANLAHHIDGTIEDSREKSLALTHLEEALMWAGKAIFRA